MPIKKTKKEYIEEAQKIHNYKYDYSQIIELPKRDFLVNIICQQHGIFEQSFHKHLLGDGCKKCAFEKIGKDKIEKAKNKFINDVTIKHNNKYNYSKLNYISAKEKIIITCPIHGDFEQTPNSHLNGNGCGKCANEKTKERMSIPWNIYKEDLQKIHNNKYNYSKVIWKGVDIDIIVECPTHGEFEIRPANHKRGRGCHSCLKEIFVPHNKLDTQKFIEKSIEIRGNKYDYTKSIYIDAKTKLIIICKEHGEFEQTPNSHLNGNGCRKCRPNYSKKQIEWLNFISKLKNISIQHAENDNEYLILNTRFHADGYCKETNTIYEFHGDLWHGNPKLYDKNNTSYFGVKYGELYENTLKREQLIRDLGYNLVVIWEYDWNKINKSIKILQRKFRNSKLH
jgi:hypothetical protein